MPLFDDRVTKRMLFHLNSPIFSDGWVTSKKHERSHAYGLGIDRTLLSQFFFIIRCFKFEFYATPTKQVFCKKQTEVINLVCLGLKSNQKSL